MQPIYHYAPATGWLNDPNGLISVAGRHHLFYQYNPRVAAGRLAENMAWGHASSPDLVNWTEHEPALLSGGEGSAFDEDGCWSGCAFPANGRVVALYSGCQAGRATGRTLPCLATAVDDSLVEWVKHPGNPVIGREPPIGSVTDFRDHSVRMVDGAWHQAVGGGFAGTGAIFGYRSADLVDWSYEGVLLEARQQGLPGQVWECPDVFEVDAVAVAIVSVMDGPERYAMWVTGTFSGTRLQPAAWGTVDMGDRLYAPQSYRAGADRRLLVGWLRLQLDDAALGQPNLGAMSVPCVVTVSGGRVLQQPAPELDSLRAELLPGPTDGPLPEPQDALEILVEPAAGCTVRLRDRDGGVELVVDAGALAAQPSHRVRRGPRWISVPGSARSARIYVDRGLVEVFLDDGRTACFSELRLTAVSEIRVAATAGGVPRVSVWRLRRPAPAPAGASRTTTT